MIKANAVKKDIILVRSEYDIVTLETSFLFMVIKREDIHMMVKIDIIVDIDTNMELEFKYPTLVSNS